MRHFSRAAFQERTTVNILQGERGLSNCLENVWRDLRIQAPCDIWFSPPIMTGRLRPMDG
jgi:hypothetical protein